MRFECFILYELNENTNRKNDQKIIKVLNNVTNY